VLLNKQKFLVRFIYFQKRVLISYRASLTHTVGSKSAISKNSAQTYKLAERQADIEPESNYYREHCDQ